MQLPRKAAKLEWNLNTLISLVQFVTIIGGVGWMWANTTRDIQELKNWQKAHDEYHKERLADTRATTASFNERLRAEEVRGNEVDRKIDNLTYRVTVAEQSAVTITTSIRDLQSGFNQQASDIKVVKEIVQRLEAAQQGRSR